MRLVGGQTRGVLACSRVMAPLSCKTWTVAFQRSEVLAVRAAQSF